MAEFALYLESSALVKLVLEEPESPALIEFLPAFPRRFSSALCAIEVPRAVRRALPGEAAQQRAREVLRGLELVAINEPLIAAASSLLPETLRSLDAIHLATALAFGPELAGMVVYDQRLRDAARAAGITIHSPA